MDQIIPQTVEKFQKMVVQSFEDLDQKYTVDGEYIAEQFKSLRKRLKTGDPIFFPANSIAVSGRFAASVI